MFVLFCKMPLMGFDTFKMLKTGSRQGVLPNSPNLDVVNSEGPFRHRKLLLCRRSQILLIENEILGMLNPGFNPSRFSKSKFSKR